MRDWTPLIHERLRRSGLDRSHARDAVDELSAHLDHVYRSVLAQGRSEAEAAAAAEAELDGLPSAAITRRHGSNHGRPTLGGVMSGLIRDGHHAARACTRAPLTSLLAIGAFALGIGITTAMFSVFFHVLLKPLPYPAPERLVALYDTLPFCLRCPASLPNYFDWKARATSFSAMGGSTPATMVLTGAGPATQVPAMRATSSLADVFGVRPAIGRWFGDAEDVPNGPRVAVLAHGFWTDQFGRDRGIIGRTITLSGIEYEVIGVMPEGFTHRNASVFVPLAARPNATPRASRSLSTYARLRDGVSAEQARTEMRAIVEGIVGEFGGEHGSDVVAYSEVVVGAVRPQLRLLLGVVAAILLIGCVNVANLLLASGLSRRHEFSVRLALGARVSHVARQLVAESVVLATVGGLAGIAIAAGLLNVFVALAGNQLPRASSVSIDGWMLLFAISLSLVVGVACGLWPVIRLRASMVAGAIRNDGARTIAGGPSQVGGGLVVAEIAMAFALLVAGGLLLKNLMLLQSRDLGLQSTGIVAFDLAPSGPRYGSAGAVRTLYDELNTRLGGIGGVAEVGSISHLPIRRSGFNGPMQREGGPLPAGVNPAVEFRWYTGNYFSALAIPLVRGRMLDARDHGTAQTVLINEHMAHQFWPGEDALGKRFGQGNDTRTWWEVVGIVGNVRSGGVTVPLAAEFYQPLERGGAAAQTIVLRSAADDPLALLPSARAIVESVDPALAVAGVQTMENIVSQSMGTQRLVSSLTSVFAGLAALLAMLGIFGVMTYNVRRQVRELGIRIALGADAVTLRSLVLTRGLRLGTLGAAIGAIGAWLATGMLRGFLNDVQPTDVTAFAGAGVVVLVATMAAIWWPARNAGRTDPIVALRNGA